MNETAVVDAGRAAGQPRRGCRSLAVLSDIHGVLPALDAVLAEPEVAGADLIALTGDIAAGPQPGAVLDRLAELGGRAVWIRGNCDREMAALRRGGAPDGLPALLTWAAGQLTEAQVRVLAALPRTRVVAVHGIGPVLLCHATPRDDEEVVAVDAPLPVWGAAFAGVPAEVTAVVCGHTHMPFVRLVAGRTVVNPGSVGRPYGPPGARWALLGPGVQLRCTPVDAEAVAAHVAEHSACPGGARWAREGLAGEIDDGAALRRQSPRPD